MEKYTEQMQIRWADIDANRHLRHSIYYEVAATFRMRILNSLGLTLDKLEEFMMGQVVIREEAVFRREILFEDTVTLDAEMFKATPDYAHWSMRHNFVKSDGTLAAIVSVDGAIIDMAKRKIAVPNPFILDVYGKLQRATDFYFYTPEKRA